MVYLRELKKAEIVKIYQDRGAWWTFDYVGDPYAPHAKLTSGRCADGYVDSSKVLCEPAYCELLAHNLVNMLRARNAVLPVDWIVGSPYAAITFSYEVARQLGVRHGFAEKDPANPKKLVWTSRFAIPGGASVLQVEELITTLGTTLEVRTAVEQGNPEPVRFLPDVATVIYRPEKLQGGMIDVIALVRREMKSWAPEDCPLCAQGSEPLRPKENWKRLTSR